MCGICVYSSRCIDYQEDQNKFDERRDFIREGVKSEP